MNKFSDSTLTINLSAIANNYALLRDRASGSKTAAVVKAGAYGLGVDKVAPALFTAGCRDFFVANLDEAIELRKILPDVFIGVFHGVSAAQEEEFVEYGLTPVLNSIYQVKLWKQHADKQFKKLDCMIHIDTGMNRLGMSFSDAESAAEMFGSFNVKFIMSHLASADTPDDIKNIKQLEKISLIKRRFPQIPISFANSSGVFIGDDYLFDMVRPGSAIYGVNPTPYAKNPMLPVIKLTSRILQIRVIDTAETVGYGASCRLPAGSKIATLPIGYADGYIRSLGNKGYCAIDGQLVPIVGRVSMDLITVDVTSIKERKLQIGNEVELIGKTIKIDDLAGWAGTIGYEILTGLGSRYLRHYTLED
jgi:alanine racemase